MYGKINYLKQLLCSNLHLLPNNHRMNQNLYGSECILSYNILNAIYVQGINRIISKKYIHMYYLNSTYFPTMCVA